MSLSYSCNENTGAVTVWDGPVPYADLTDTSNNFGQKVERARLICAAPDLLASVEALQRLWDAPDDEQDSRWDDAVEDAEAALYTAVDRARGRFVSDEAGGVR